MDGMNYARSPKTGNLSALLRPLDEKVFEDSAWALLSQIYPNLTPMRGGDDEGFDGAAISTDEPRIPLICTVSPYPDSGKNLRRSLKKVKESGSAATHAFFATPKLLTNAQRRSLEDLAKKEGFKVVEVFEHDWFREQLYKDDSWRLELLGVAGRPSALSPIPRGARIGGPTTLVGRDEQMAQLCSQDWGYFLVDSDREAIANAIRRLHPRRIIVDDAHFNTDVLDDLQQLRGVLQIPFYIVATSWPADADAISSQLKNAELIQVPLLSLDDIATVVRSAGISGPPELIQSIVHQARGRAGLATTLAQLCMSGRAIDVARGDALLKNTVGRYQRLLKSDTSLLLAVISLSGDSGVNEGTLQSVLGLDRLELADMLRKLAQGGVIEAVTRKDIEGSYLRVQPEALRYAAVYDQFFKAAGAPTVWDIVDAFPDPACATLPLIGAIYRGAPLNHDKLRKLITQRPDEQVVRMYARLGRNEAEFCLAALPQYSRQIAVEVLDFAADLGIPILLNMATTDTRPLNSNPDHPLRQIKDFLSMPENVTERRRAIADSILEWLSKSGEVEIALAALSSALKVSWEDILLQPGSGNTVTIRSGRLRLDDLNIVADLWDDLLKALELYKNFSFSSLLEALEDLCYQGPHNIPPPSKAWTETSRRIARLIILKMASQFSERPGLLHRLKGLTKRVGIRVAFPKAEDFDTLFPHDPLSQQYDAERQKHAEEAQWRAARRLALDWLKQPPIEVAERLVELEQEAEAAGVRWPRLTPGVAEVLAESSTEPQTYLVELAKRGAPGDIVSPFVWAVARRKPDGWRPILAELYANASYNPIAVMVGLVEDVGSELREQAIALCDSRIVKWLEFQKTSLSEDVLLKFLRHPDPTVVTAAVVRLGLYNTGDLTSAVRPTWEEAVIIQEKVEYAVATILSRNSNLLVRWVEQYIVRASSSSFHWEHFLDDLMRAVGALGLKERIGLLQFLAKQPNPSVDGELFVRLVGSDEEAISLVFKDLRLKGYRKSLLHGTPDDAWLARAILALDSGMELDEIAASCLWGYGGFTWAGKESDKYRGYFKAFRELQAKHSEKKRKAIIEAGIRQYEKRLEHALREERKDDVYGR